MTGRDRGERKERRPPVRSGGRPPGTHSRRDSFPENVSEVGDSAEGMVFGFQSVRTTLKVSPRKVERVLLERGRRDARTREIVNLAREANVPFQQVPTAALDRLAGAIRHQGIGARVAGAELLDADEVIETLPSDALVLLLDGVEDPRNVGAVLRSAAGFGVSAVFLPEWRSAGLGPAAARTAAGGLELVPVARAGNSAHLLERLAQEGFRVIALEPEGGSVPWETDLKGRVALVAGGEEKGVRPGVAKKCQERVRIPIRPEIGSLNVSVAVAVVLAEAIRQRFAFRGPSEPALEPPFGVSPHRIEGTEDIS